MRHNRLLSLLLTAALIAQTVIAGWGHSHAHLSDNLRNHSHDVASHSHHHHPGVRGHYHANSHDTSHQHPSLPSEPASGDDCTVCRHLALAAIFTLDHESVSVEQACEAVHVATPLLLSITAVGLRRPRGPPALS